VLLRELNIGLATFGVVTWTQYWAGNIWWCYVNVTLHWQQLVLLREISIALTTSGVVTWTQYCSGNIWCCYVNLILYWQVSFFSSRRYSAACIWAVRWIGYVNAINEPTGSDNRYLSDKIMTFWRYYVPLKIQRKVYIFLLRKIQSRKIAAIFWVVSEHCTLCSSRMYCDACV
jgi:hypothetical protein